MPAPVGRPVARLVRQLSTGAVLVFALALVGAGSGCSSGSAGPGNGDAAVPPPAASGGTTAPGGGGTTSSTGGGGGAAGHDGAGGGPMSPGGTAGRTGTAGSAGATAPATGGMVAAGGRNGVGGAPSSANGGGAGGAPASGQGGSPATSDPDRRRLLFRDEGQSMVSYVDLGNPATAWHVTTPTGRDMQLVGGSRFMIGTDNGYEERLLSTGALVSQRSTFPGTQTAHRLRNGNTILAGVNWQGGTGIVLVEVDAGGVVVHKVMLPGTYVRLIRQTPTGTFLVAAENLILESDAAGKVVWQANIANPPAGGAHAWQALRIPSGETVVSAGYAASIQVFGPDGSLRRTITGPANVLPDQFVGMQILPTGNFLVANWQGHSGENMGTQLLEYSPDGRLVWSYRPNTRTESLSLHHVIVLDGLDVTKLHVDDTTGVLVPVP